MFVDVSERQLFSPNCSKFAVECDWNSKISQNEKKIVFFEKIDGFLRKKTLNFSKSLNVATFLLNAYQMAFFLKMCFPLELAKNQKIFKVVEIRKYDKEAEFFGKKRFHLLKRHLYQNGRAENTLVVAGRFDIYCLEINFGFLGHVGVSFKIYSRGF